MSLFHPNNVSLETKSKIPKYIRLDILSPPLSPYQRNNAEESNLQLKPQSSVTVDNAAIKSYINSKPFDLENFKNYDLTLKPSSNFKNYKSNHFNFLKKYSIIKNKENAKNFEKIYKKRKYNTNSFMDNSDSSEDSKVRTRRIVKEFHGELSEKKSFDNFSRDSSPTPKKKKPAVSQPFVIDENIPDYSPDLSTLPNNNKCLKIDWKGQPMDLSDDPNISKLHPAEAYLASILRLSVNLYLDSKRRLFYEKVQRLQSGMQFRRTDAQKACRIDVNKASRLFAAFEKVGWLNDDLFTKYL